MSACQRTTVPRLINDKNFFCPLYVFSSFIPSLSFLYHLEYLHDCHSVIQLLSGHIIASVVSLNLTKESLSVCPSVYFHVRKSCG